VPRLGDSPPDQLVETVSGHQHIERCACRATGARYVRQGRWCSAETRASSPARHSAAASRKGEVRRQPLRSPAEPVLRSAEIRRRTATEQPSRRQQFLLLDPGDLADRGKPADRKAAAASGSQGLAQATSDRASDRRACWASCGPAQRFREDGRTRSKFCLQRSKRRPFPAHPRR